MNWMLIAGLLAVLAGGAAPASEVNRFLWNQANARMAAAETPEDFAEASTLYRSLLDRGVRNAPLLRNYGTALLLAEAPEAAMDAFLRAERHGGSTADLRRNLLVAFTAERVHQDAPRTQQTLSWTRIPLFWHYQIPLRQRLSIVLWLHGLLWGSAFCKLLGRRDAARGLAASSLAGLVLFGSSVLVSLQQDSTPLPDFHIGRDSGEEAGE